MNTQIYEEACNWFVELRTGDVDAAGRKRFDAWIRQSPEHVRAYLEVTELWQDASQTGFGGDRDVDALVARARAEDDENVIHLGPGARSAVSSEQGDTAARARGARAIGRPLAIAASVLIAVSAVALYAWYALYRLPSYYTSIGEQRVISLGDGSSVKLNTRSRIRVRFSERERAIDLVEGQALFQVAKDASRPFTVNLDEVQVRAVGTQFDVYRKESAATITVVEGNVVVRSDLPAKSHPDARRQALTTGIAAGQQLIVAFDANEPLTPQPASVETATAWTQQKLVFRSSSLPDVAEEFNRYNKRQLVIADAALQAFRISGVYSSTDPSLLLTFLREQPGIHVEETEDVFIISQQK